LKSTLKSSDGLVREIGVEIPVETVNAAFSETYAKYRKEAKVKGFRPGKAPMDVIKSMYHDDIHAEIIQNLVTESYRAAIAEHNLNVASAPDFPSFDELKEGSPFSYAVKVEVLPEVEKVDYQGLELPQIEMEVRDPEVDSIMQYLRKKNATLSKVDRTSTAEDVVIIDLTKIEDPSNALQSDEFKDFEIDLAERSTVKEFSEGLVGLKAGDEKELSVGYPKDFSTKELAGKKVKFRCHVKEVKEKILPPENDNFAKTQGNFASMLELRLQIRKDIKKQKELDHKQWQKQEIMRQIVAKNQIEIPPAMVDEFLEKSLERIKKENPEADVEVLREQQRPYALDTLRWSILMEKLAETENIEVLPADTENWIMEFAKQYKMEYGKAKEALAQSGKNQQIRDSILEDKVIDFLISKAKFVPMDTPETGDKAGDEQAEGSHHNNIAEEKADDSHSDGS